MIGAALPGFCRQSGFWFGLTGAWFAALWLMSSGAQEAPDIGFIPHIDKVLHFGYFLGGGGLLSAALYCRRPAAPAWGWMLLTAMVMAGLVGWLDEWHQSFVPERSGNDFGDWMADFFGATAGALIFCACHPVLGLAAKKI